MRLEDRLALALSLLSGILIAAIAVVSWLHFGSSLTEEIGRQQFAILTASTDHLDSRLDGAQKMLIASAESLTPTIVADADRAQAWLDGRKGLRTQFDNHLFIFSAQGRLLAESPFEPGRRGTDLSFRDYFRRTAATRQAQISNPYLSSQAHHHPVIMMTAPLLDDQGRLLAILAGSIDLLGENFIGRLARASLGQTGHFFLTTDQRVILAHPSQERIFTTLTPGTNALYDRAIDGFEGIDETIDSEDRPAFAAFKRLRTLPWLLAATYPRDEALAPVARFTAILTGIALLAFLLTAYAVRLIVRRQMAPLSAFTGHLADLPQKTGDARFIDLPDHPEMSLLCGTFNQLIGDLDKRQAALATSEDLYRTLADFATDFIYWRGADGRILYASETASQMTGYPPESFYDDPRLLDLMVLEEDRQLWHGHTHRTDDNGCSQAIEFRIRDARGQVRWVSHNCHPVIDDRTGFRGVRGNHRDITAQKLEDERQRLAASLFDSSREAIMITDSRARIIAVNPAFTAMTGYREDEVAGQNPRLLKSGRHSAEFYEEFWQTLSQQGQWQGEMWNRRKNGDLYVANSHIEAVRDAGGRLLHYVCGQTDTTRLKRAENHMEYLVTHDSLTSLANRPALEQIAELCLAHHEDPLDESTVMIVDLDRFKDVNDSLGHGIGDLLLSQVGKRLAALSRRSDIVARMGGDEFGLVFPGLTRASALPMAEKILATLHDPIILQEHTFGLSASIGIAVHPHDGRTIGELLKNADTALHQAKSEGRNAAVFYSREMNQATYEILRLEAELRSAIDEGQLVTFYQPKIRLDDGAPIGAEALVRWQHPSRGLIAPAEFIPIAERSGLINDIGKWVLGDVCRQLARWRDRGLSPLPVAVNLAARHFRSPELPALVSTLLDTHQLPTEMLELELTETTLLVAGLQVQANLAELRRLGVSLAIDDFGTGYSSLSYLKRMPINVLKIDQSFVRDLESGTDDQALVTSIIALGHSLGLKLVAEGVETDRQAEILRRQGCDFGQGYLFGRPVPADEYVAWHSARVAENP